MDFRTAIEAYIGQPLSGQLLMEVLKGYKRPHDKIDELVKQGFLVQVKRGLYVPGPKLKLPVPELFLIANHLYGPSYISLDSALQHWGLIPERVYEITSVTTNPSKKVRTAIGRFIYTRLALPYYAFGIQQVSLTRMQTVLMAGAEKAVCDKIVLTRGVILRSVKQTKEILVEDFRIDTMRLKELDIKMISSWVKDAPKGKSLAMLVKTLQTL
ncbi:type IV toxin-antitoxin system AbiEi family antitoxin domain-containing protein [Terrimonas ferruginea]|uniref:type IV toxin-antitoxin system AbiEi family antitoxin domain-containing protein n=1 Tax=Terrimonas ferruginea TaxID=249 RepID=UPI0004172E31|nr:hypothetical protein [Terrimonas ferruginea]